MLSDKPFTHRLFLTPVFSYIGAFAIAYAVYALCTGLASLWWGAVFAVSTFFMMMGTTVGLHRLFCHQAFTTSTFWKIVLAYFGTLSLYGSTVQWAGMHMAHHEFSDTEKDPHFTGWSYLIWKKHNQTQFNKRTLIRLYKDPLHKFLHDYYMVVVLATICVLCIFSVQALVFLYLAPLGWLHFVESIHKVFSHDKAGPKDQGLLEIPFFTGGEWEHKHHHDFPKDIRFGRMDLGYWFIRLIRTR